jgi:hypothetical protein
MVAILLEIHGELKGFRVCFGRCYSASKGLTRKLSMLLLDVSVRDFKLALMMARNAFDVVWNSDAEVVRAVSRVQNK